MTEQGTGRRRLRELAWVFTRLGVVAFGGPVAHVAMMREELVRRRGWVDDARFLDLWSATHLVPGPNSTELAIHLGHERAGWRGLVLAGVLFIAPAALLVTGLAWVYVEHGSTPAFTAVLSGVVPVVVAIVLWSLVGLARPALKGSWLTLLAASVLGAWFAGVHELGLLLGAGVLVVLVRGARRVRRPRGPSVLLGPWWAVGREGDGGLLGGDLSTLFATMVKIGAVLYGSGYVLFAFLEGEFVDRLGWLTAQQLVDAVAIGQVTPGPLFTSATFVGYVVAGWPGAFVATVGIFLPSFLFVGLLTRISGRLRDRWWTAAFLDGVNASAWALMAAVTWVLGREAVVGPMEVVLVGVTLVLLWRTRWNSAWYVLGGAVVGLLV